MSPIYIVLNVVVLIVIVTLSWFSYVQYLNYNRRAVNWNLLNLLGGITIALTLNSIIPHYFLFGRTEAQCYLLHHWSGSFYNLTNWLSPLFFQCRSNQIAPEKRRDTLTGQLMAGAIVIITIAATI